MYPHLASPAAGEGLFEARMLFVLVPIAPRGNVILALCAGWLFGLPTLPRGHENSTPPPFRGRLGGGNFQLPPLLPCAILSAEIQPSSAPPTPTAMPNELIYLDFEIDVSPDNASGGYTIAVVKSPAGEVRASAFLPFGELQLKNRLLELQNALLRSGGPRRRGLTEHEKTVQNFGRELFDFLLAGEVRSLYRSSREKASAASRGLRLKLRISDPALAALPWEFLFDSTHNEYICLSTQTPLVRYLELAHPPQILAVTPPLRILGLIASPEGLDRLDVALEKQRVEEALADLLADGLIELHWLAGQTRRDLQRAMRRGPWHIFHYIGHGGFDPIHQEGLLYLADSGGKAEALTARQLATMLGDHPSLRTVFLNACEGAASSQSDLFSGTAATLMRRGIPAVLAMQYAITDRAAIEFTTTLYESLADGYPVDAAVTEARKAISLAVNHSVEWGTPVLHMRAPDGVVFELQGKRQSGEGQEEGKRQSGEGKSGSDVPPVVGVVRVPAEVATVRASVVAPPALQFPIAIDWVTIPAGEFLMGSDKAKDSDAYDDELPQHRVYLPEYRISRTPVTNSQYLRFVEATGQPTPKHWNDGKIPNSKEDHPVVNVSWHDAQAFCKWVGARLPTEAEWEKAARGVDGRIWPWGNGSPTVSHGNFDGNIGDTTPVQRYPAGASPYGVLDMAGNVWEWTQSLWGKDGSKPEYGYPYRSGDGRENLQAADDVRRVLRGGSFDLNRFFARCAYRYWFVPDLRDGFGGFRLLSPGS